MPFFFLGGATSTAATTTVTVSNLITAAFQRLNLVAAGESLAPEDLALGFARLNDLVDAWAIERLTIFGVTRTTWTISTAASYTVGTGGTINVARPSLPNDVAIAYQDTSLSPTQEYSLGEPLTDAAWQAIGMKTLTAPYPTCAYYDPTYGTTGYGTVKLWPIPTSSTLQGVLYAPEQVSEFALTSDLVALPPGYRRALRDNLAIEIAQDYQGAATVTPQLERSAIDSKASLKRANIRLVDLENETATLFSGGAPTYNINTD